ncbi:hypothetical protein RFM98_18630 [Mesorhizobium sp. VK9D]|uniref:hypothetical protein n=1 Tax=Mesorhizobium australafricanum TaxID=3072311 RepID=UPI002A24DC34|nr:hypothetical protein [Mesorhizobium sp. VK9D]MDX8454784.1 hypothetical protein [Mesorhizobium sp. VK9D]
MRYDYVIASGGSAGSTLAGQRPHLAVVVGPASSIFYRRRRVILFADRIESVWSDHLCDLRFPFDRLALRIGLLFRAPK